jgi:hypothetical protein
MAEEIVIKTVLDVRESTQKVKQDLTNALNSPEVQNKAREAGRKIGDALGLGIETTRRSREDKELAHQRRLEAISAQSNARILEIERRKQAQLDLIRERAVQKELEHQQKLERAIQSGAGGISSLRSAIAGISGAFGVLAGLGIVSLFERVGREALDAAVSVDKQVSTLRALTGSAEAAQKRFQELFKIAQQTPGLTTNLAAQLDAQLRVFNVAEQTINKLLPVIGRLNAIGLRDPATFVQNLTQLISGNFEKSDLKELVENSPIAGQLVKQIFNVDSPVNAEAIRQAARRLGITTVERLAEEFIKAGENNPALKNAVETIAGQFEKLKDRLTVALAPVGEQLAKVLLPIFNDLVKTVEQYGASAASVFRENRNDIIATAKEITAMAVEVGKLVGKIVEVGARSGIFKFLARSAGAIQDILNDPFSLEAVGPAERAAIARFDALDAEAAAVRNSPFLGSATRDLSSSGRGASGDFGGGGGGGGSLGGGRRGARAANRPPKDLLSAAFVKTPEFDLAKAQKGIDEHMADLARVEIQRQKDEVQAFTGIVKAIQEGEAKRAREAEEAINVLERTSRRALTRSGRFIEDALSRGQITPGEAELLRQGAAGQFAGKLQDVFSKRQAAGADPSVLEDLRDEIDLFNRLSVSVSDTERFMRGFNSQIETSGDAFDRFGANVSRAFGNVKDLFNGLKQAVLSFFNDLLGQSLQNLVRNTLGGLFGSLGGSLGGIFGGGNIFRTPSTFGNFAQAFAGAAGGGISAPPSITGAQRVEAALDEFFGPAVSRSAGSIATGGTSSAFSGFSLSGLGSSLLGTAPFLGAGLGSAIGGQSTAGRILGAIGGGAVGLGLSFGASVFSAAGGGLGALGPAALAALGPIALIGAPLLIGGLLLGKASQRHKDEEAAGEFQRQAHDQLAQLKAGIASDQIDGAQARTIFDTQILGVFRQQIQTLKTKSVVESRLKNQTRDIEGIYQAIIVPEIAAQQKRRADAARFSAIDSRLIPQFNAGGTVPGIDRGRDSVLAMLRPGEKVLTLGQQASVIAQSNPGVFDRAGVPRAGVPIGPAQAFQYGGTAQAASWSGAMIDTLVVEVEFDAEGMVRAGLKGRNGEDLVARKVEARRRRRRNA